MPTVTQNIFNDLTALAGWENNIVTAQNLDNLTSSNSAFKHHIASNIFDDKHKIETKEYLDIDAIYFTDNYPVIYIKQLAEYNENHVIEIQKKFWNECRTPLSIIITPQKIVVIDNYEVPQENATKFILKDFEYNTTTQDLKRLAEVLKQSKLDSELVIGNTIKLNTQNRVDKKLIKQLQYVRKILHDSFKLPFSIIHDILGRSLFTLYLEQRNILTPQDIKEVTKLDATFFDLLLNHPAETMLLFEFLKDKFNGDLFPITPAEIDAITKNPQILNLVYNCFTGKQELNTFQFSIFNLFDFKYIPIELISAIYEEFMSEEDNEKNKIIDVTKKNKDDLGAFYTPQMLVEFVYNEVLPMPSKDDCNYKLKILDPACGSGIFLVEGFKRIIERYKYATQANQLNKDILNTLLNDSIYGIDIHPEAIKITAFSLYLTYINNMNPRDILGKVKFNPLINWTSANEIKEREGKKFGSNLLEASTFILETPTFKNSPNQTVNTFFNNSFDIVIGNPPWKRSYNKANEETKAKPDIGITSWAKANKWDLGSEIVKAYLAYLPTIAPNAKVAILSSAKVLFNTSDVKFRNKFFTDYKVSVITNFSVVRNVLFEKATQACALLIYQNRNGEKYLQNESIIYVVPKTQKPIQNRNAITIDASEIKFLPITEVVKPKTKIFKIAMYGNMRDLNFIERLSNLKENYTDNIIKGMGLINDKDAICKGNLSLGNFNVIEADEILPYYTPQNKTLFKTHTKFNEYRTDDRDIFKGPLILFKEGTKFGELCCSFIDYDCVFFSNSQSFKFIGKDIVFHKSYIACLNSSLATYYFINVASNWGVSKGGMLQKNEVQLFPNLPYIFTENTNLLLSNEVNEIIRIMNSNSFDDLLIREKILPIKNKIDQIIYKELKITEEEQALITHTLNNSNVIKYNYKDSHADWIVEPQTDIKVYAETYLEVINHYLKNAQHKLNAEIYTRTSKKDELVCVHFKFIKTTKSTITYNQAAITEILKEINEFVHNKFSTSIEYRKVIKYENAQDQFYLIKPNQKRFWSQAQALTDADGLVLELLNSRNK